MRARVKTAKKESSNAMPFSEVKTVHHEQDCNALILSGWQILHVGVSHVDHNGFNAKPTFIMAKPKELK